MNPLAKILIELKTQDMCTSLIILYVYYYVSIKNFKKEDLEKLWKSTSRLQMTETLSADFQKGKN